MDNVLDRVLSTAQERYESRLDQIDRLADLLALEAQGKRHLPGLPRLESEDGIEGFLENLLRSLLRDFFDLNATFR